MKQAEIDRLRWQIDRLNKARENWVDINAAAGREIERLHRLIHELHAEIERLRDEIKRLKR